jgi:hypothetical protein
MTAAGEGAPVTEADWLAANSPFAMLRFVSDAHDTSARKLRLVLCAACRGLWEELYDPRSRQAVELAELYADGLASEEELLSARRAARAAAKAGPWPAGRWAYSVVNSTAANIHWSVRRLQQFPAEKIVRPLQDIFGNPWLHPVRVEPAWLARGGGLVPRLALAIYDDRAFGRLPVLADALEDAGCTDATLLGHLRETEPHWRGCRALDLLLAKS